MPKEDKNSPVHHNAESFLRQITPVQGKVFAYIISRWPNRADAEEIMQETMTTLWSKYDDYEQGTDFLAWAVTVAKYKIMSWRKKKAHQALQFNEEAMKVLDNRSNEFLKRYDTRIGALKECIEKLTKSDKTLIELKYFKELPVKRISIRYGITPRAVYKTLSRVHSLLMRCVRRNLGEVAVHE